MTAILEIEGAGFWAVKFFEDFCRLTAGVWWLSANVGSKFFISI